MIKQCVQFLKKHVTEERCSDRLAVSFCMGNFIAFSPFIGLHTAMAFFCAWVFRLNLPVILTASLTINNIWTLVPIYMTDYVFGYWLVHKATRLGLFVTNPAWMSSINTFFEANLGLAKPCVWSFLVGGNILGLVTSFLLYPVMRLFFARLAVHTRKVHHVS